MQKVMDEVYKTFEQMQATKELSKSHFNIRQCFNIFDFLLLHLHNESPFLIKLDLINVNLIAADIEVQLDMSFVSGKARGATDVELIEAFQNFAMIFGCSPNNGVKANTTMCTDIKKSFKENFDHVTMICNFPDVLEHLKGNDANFEMDWVFDHSDFLYFENGNHAPNTQG